MRPTPSHLRAARRRGAVLLAAVLAAPAAHGWGIEGHRIVGDLAEQFLDPRSLAALRELSGDAGLASVGLAMDADRQRLRRSEPGSERWHFDNRPLCRPSAAVASYCGGGDCASAAYGRELAILADHRAPAARRRFALEVVVHVLADVHQPLHVADNGDRGGNDIEVVVGRRGRPTTLHGAWDHDYVKRALAGRPQAEFVHELAARYRGERVALERGTIASWMQESYALAHDYAYGRLPSFTCGVARRAVIRLPVGYSDGAAEVVAGQLARAGIRLAAVLRAAL